MKFLHDIFEGDTQQIDLLQEWFGYCLTQDTRYHKMLLMIGPKRAGKGTIGRILTPLVGEANVAAPTLGGLAGTFGLAPLIGKSLAIVPDARLSGRTDQSIIVERLLSISGEDAQTIDRKHKPHVFTRLPVRFMLLTNELPKLIDASGALTSRFLILTLKKSHLGAEDHGLEAKLLEEVPAIARWAIEGLKELIQADRFTTPDAAANLREEFDDLGSPISAFLRDWCHAEGSVAAKDAFDAWTVWAKQNGIKNAGDAATFGRDLRAVLPHVSLTRPRLNGVQVRTYEGLTLTASATEMLAVARSGETSHPRYSSKNAG